MATTILGKRTRSGRQMPTCAPAEKRQRLEMVETESDLTNDENKDPVAAVPPKTPSKPSRTWTVSSARKPLTPRTPRFRDQSASTPGTRTPKSVRMLAHPKTPVTPSSIPTVYQVARQLFSRNAEPDSLVGRDAEREQITRFLQRCQRNRPSGCLYVSGPPGTGKSAMVRRVTQDSVEHLDHVKNAYVNCMSIKSAKELYSTVLELLSDPETLTDSSDPLAALQSLFVSRKATGTYVVVLDEVDHLLTVDSESLHGLFELALQKTSRLALIGIANALDLTDRFLPRLKARNLKPELLPFLPYTAAQIKEVLTSRLQSLHPQDDSKPRFLPFIHPAAIELCSRKVASHSGDLRRAFEICRRAIDLIESQTKEKYENEARDSLVVGSPSRTPLRETTNQSSPRKAQPSSVWQLLTKSLQKLTVETAPRVSISHLNKVTAAAFSNGSSHRVKTLNLQQKAALCSLVSLEKRNRGGVSGAAGGLKSAVMAPTVKSLYETYCRLCKREDMLHPLSNSEFREVMGSLEALSLVAVVDAKAASSVRGGRRGGGNTFGDEKRVSSAVGEDEMDKAVEGLGSDILRKILSGAEALV